MPSRSRSSQSQAHLRLQTAVLTLFRLLTGLASFVSKASPVKCQDLFVQKNDEDPRPAKFQNWPGYNDYVRNQVIGFCFSSGKDLPMRHMYKKANLFEATHDHNYFGIDWRQYWVDYSLKITEKECEQIQSATRQQSHSSLWFRHREWRLTASHFGTIFHLTARRDLHSLCNTILNPRKLNVQPIIHGKTYEPIARRAFEEEMSVTVDSSGLWILPSFPYLGATPDGLVGSTHTIEIKCPYTARENHIAPGKDFSFLEFRSDGRMALRISHPYYCQIQGGLALSKRDACYFIVYTPCNGKPCILIEEVQYDDKFWKEYLLPKLRDSYFNHYRGYIAANAAALN